MEKSRDPEAMALAKVFALILSWPKPGEKRESANEETVYEAPSSLAEDPIDSESEGRLK